MSTLFEQIKQDRIVAFKNKESVRKDILGVLIAESSKDTKEPDAEKIVSTIKKLIKGCNEIIDIDPLSVKGTTASIEKDILESYLPKQLTEKEIWVIINDIFVLGGNKISIGEIMRYFKDNYPNAFDGSVVSRVTNKIFKGESL